MELRELAGMTGADAAPMRVLAPWLPDDAVLQAEVARLRGQGAVVISDLPGHEAHRHELACARQLVAKNGKWMLEPCADGAVDRKSTREKSRS
jgi:ATP phosphoribosyltransferase regulatory subunit